MLLLTKSTICLLALALFTGFNIYAQGFAVTITVVQPISCNGMSDGQLNASASIPGAGGSFQYLWSNGMSGANIQNLSAGTYTVTATSVTGGSATASATLSEPAPFSTDISVNGILTCSNTSVLLSAAPTGGITPLSFEWSTGETTHSINASAPGQIDLLLTDSHGCQATASAEVEINNTAPLIEGPGFDSIYCTNAQIQLDKTCTSSSTVGYEWTTPNGHIELGGNTDHPTVDLPGTYYVVVVDFPTGCTAVDSVEVSANYLAVLADTPGPVYTNVIPVTTSGGVGPFTYLWKSSDGIISASTEDLSNVPAGHYVLTATDAAGCAAVLGPLQLVVTSAVITPEAAGIRVFPNPVSISVQIDLPDENEIQLRAFNNAGQLILSSLVEGPNARLTVSEWPEGWYTLVLNHSKGVSSIRILVQ